MPLWDTSPCSLARTVSVVGVAAGIAPVARQKRRLLGGALLILSLAAFCWMFTCGLELGASGLNAKLWIPGLESGGMVSVPLARFGFILQ